MFLWAKPMTNLDKDDYKSKKKLQFGRKKLKLRWNYKSRQGRLQIGASLGLQIRAKGLQIGTGITNRGKMDYKSGQRLQIGAKQRYDKIKIIGAKQRY